jgi:hypothetical protein
MSSSFSRKVRSPDAAAGNREAAGNSEAFKEAAMMRVVFLILAVIQTAAAQSAANPIGALRSRLSAAEELETSGSRMDTISEYLSIAASATALKTSDPDRAPEYSQILSGAALHAATLLEPSCPTEDHDAGQRAIAQYEIARKAGKSDQRALAANNMAVFLWRCRVASPDPRSVMNGIPFDELNEELRSGYRDNYARLLEQYAQQLEESSSSQQAAKFWQGAADQYLLALTSTPSDETALAGIAALLDKLSNGIAFAAKVGDLLTRTGQGQIAVDLILKSMKTAPALSSQDCAQPLAILVQAFAASGITVEEFRTSYAPALAEVAVRHKLGALSVAELNRAFLGDVSITSSASSGHQAGDSQPDQMCRFPNTIVPLVSGLDRALSVPFESAEGKAVQRLFPQGLALGENQSLSRLLEFAAAECAQRTEPDIGCAGQKFAAAWLFDPGNTSAAVDLALLCKTENPPKELQDFLLHAVAPFYASSGQGLKAFYSEPSHPRQLDNHQQEDVQRLNALLNLPYKPLSVDTGRLDELQVRTLHDGDRIVSGKAPQEWEAVRVQTIRAAGNPGCPETPARQSAIAATNAVTGSFSAQLETSLAKGETVCVYGVHSGAAQKARQEKAAAVPFLHRSHTYISGGIFWSRVAGEQHYLPHAAFDKDINLGRWGYDRYQERSDRPYPALTTLVNIFAEWRFTTIAKGTTTPTGSGITNVQSLEFGGYAPLFVHRTTWTFLGQQRAAFIAPLIKGGVDFFPSFGAQSTFASGARLGVLKLLGTSSFIAPELQSYVDVVYGNSTNVLVNPHLNGPVATATFIQANSLARLQQLDVTGMLKVPETPFYVGFNVTAGPGAKQTAIFTGLRVNLRRLICRAPI